MARDDEWVITSCVRVKEKAVTCWDGLKIPIKNPQQEHDANSQSPPK